MCCVNEHLTHTELLTALRRALKKGFVTEGMMEGMEAFFSDFLFIACSNVLLTGRHGLGSFLLKEHSHWHKTPI